MAAPLALAKLDEDSHHTVDARFDLFKVPPTETSQVDSLVTMYHPIGDVNASQVQLYAPPTADYHTDMRNSYMVVHFKVKSGADDLPAFNHNDLHVYPKSSGHALWDRCTFALDSTPVWHCQTYAQMAFMRHLLESSHDVKLNGSMDAEGWIKDKDMCKDDNGVVDANIAARKKIIADSRTICCVLRMMDPFSENDRLIPPNFAIKLTLQRAPASAFLLSDRADEPTANIVVTKLDWMVRRVKASSSVVRAHTTQLIKGHPQVMHLVKHRVRSYHVPAGVKSHRVAIQEDDYLPLKVIVGIVKHASTSGDFTLSPHNFHHFNVSAIELTVDGVPVGQRLETNFADSLCGEAYASLLQATDQWRNQTTNGLTYDEFVNEGKTLFGWVTTTDLPSHDWNSYLHLKRKGALALHITFAHATPQALSVQVLDTREDLLKIDAEKRIRTTDVVV